ncbi:hypothetical protein FFI87_004845 [Burkholderia sp. KBS0801]|nr:hypothetical protein FFI87_004845 [Burkholderia sp. KBS0801]
MCRIGTGGTGRRGRGAGQTGRGRRGFAHDDGLVRRSRVFGLTRIHYASVHDRAVNLQHPVDIVASRRMRRRTRLRTSSGGLAGSPG